MPTEDKGNGEIRSIWPATNVVRSSRVAGDSYNRYEQLSNGKLQWGAGSGAIDCNLYRNSANVLKTDDALTVGAGLTITTGGATVTAGGLTVTAGGATITADGLTVTAGGATITAGGLTVTAGGATITAGGLTVTAGGETITAGDLALADGVLTQTKTTTATTGTVRGAYGKIVSNTASITTANLVGSRGECNLGAAATVTGQAYMYGAQGKFICAGTLNGSGWTFGLVGQLDVSSATLTAGSHVGAIWGDMGATAPSGACTFADNLVLTNTTDMTMNSHIYAYGKAAAVFDLSTNGSNCIVAAGTSSGSFGNADGVATKVLVCKVDGVVGYIPWHSANG